MQTTSFLPEYAGTIEALPPNQKIYVIHSRTFRKKKIPKFCNPIFSICEDTEELDFSFSERWWSYTFADIGATASRAGSIATTANRSDV